MNQWTSAAKQELENYFTRVRPTLHASGADANEVIEDLRRHLDAEVSAAKLAIVTDEDVRRLLARIGAPQPSVTEPSAAPKASAPEPAPQTAGYFLLMISVFIPFVTLIVEFTSGMCAETFYDPMPTIWHVLLVALVPVVNCFAWAAIFRNKAFPRTLFGWANGAATGIAIFYSVLFMPLMLPGLIAIIFFGMGLLPLSPALSLIGTLMLRSKLRRMSGDASAGLPGFWRGIALAWLMLLAVETPTIVTRLALKKAISDEPEQQLTGIRWLRAIGDEDKLLRDCYGYTARSQNADLWSWLIAGTARPTADQARTIYFRVTGRAFNSVPAPDVRTARGNWRELDEWTWDDDHGGDAVGGRLKGLFLESSRLDTTINADAAWSYTEWTMEFRNDSSRQDREARAQILLPPGGVVSRLTLWVNGEEREAAFAGRAQTREAYQKVAIQQRRDPVLVTTSGPNRVQMQCFPVPASGGTIKIRMGITAPLTLTSDSNGIVRLPVVLERNFTVRKVFAHTVWAQAMEGLESDCAALKLEPSNHGQVALRGMMEDRELGSPRGLLRVKRNPTTRFAWTKDTRNPGEHFVRQEVFSQTPSAPTNVILVVDGSADMAAHWEQISHSLTNLPPTVKQTFLVASDRVLTLTNIPQLQFHRPVGGQDNLPALLEAWNLAVRTPGSVIVWIHGPQPMKIVSEAALLQAIERIPVRPTIYEVQTALGPDRIVEQLENVRTLQPVLRAGTLVHDLKNLFATMQGETSSWKLRRSMVETETAAKADDAIEGTLHIARLWANDSIRGYKSAKKVDEAIKQAALFQLVTPVSGAVVLETKEQFAQNGLQPVDAQTVPSIPEPGVGALVVVGVLVMRALRNKKRSVEEGRISVSGKLW